MELEKKNKIKLAIVAFSMNFIVGNLSMLIGSSLVYLVEFYQKPTETVVLMGSSFALGRVVTSLFIGKLAEKVNPVKLLRICMVAIMCFLMLVPQINFYYAGIILAFVMGFGFAGNDAICPMFVSYVFKEKYAGALSFGQALYGLGGFSIAFLVSLTSKVGTPFYFPYYLLACFIFIVIILSYLVHYDPQQIQNSGEEQIRPLYSRNNTLSFIIVGLATLFYCAVCNIIGLYTTSYCMDMGFSDTVGGLVLSMNSIGTAIGSIVFIFVLNKVSEKTVLLMNCIIGTIAIALGLWLNTPMGYYVCFFMSGFFLGILFSVLVSISTRIGFKHIALAASLIGLSGGLGDVFAPIVTSEILSAYGIRVTFQMTVVIMMITTVFAVINYILVKKEDKEG